MLVFLLQAISRPHRILDGICADYKLDQSDPSIKYPFSVLVPASLLVLNEVMV
jgi:hypothetical protein